MHSRGEIRVVINVEEPIHRELLEHIVGEQTDMQLVAFEPDGTGPTLWNSVRSVCKNQRGQDDRLVVIESFESDDERSYRDRCSVWMSEFPGVVLIAIDWLQSKNIAMTYELRCDPIENSLNQLVNAIRHAPRDRSPCDRNS